MIRKKAFLVGTNFNSFRKGIPAEIIGVEIVKPSIDLEPRICYHVLWSDMVDDWIPIDGKEFKIISFEDILNGNIPNVD